MGETLATGAVASVRNIANPVSLARAVMEKVDFSSQIASELIFGYRVLSGEHVPRLTQAISR